MLFTKHIFVEDLTENIEPTAAIAGNYFSKIKTIAYVPINDTPMPRDVIAIGWVYNKMTSKVWQLWELVISCKGVIKDKNNSMVPQLLSWRLAMIEDTEVNNNCSIFKMQETGGRSRDIGPQLAFGSLVGNSNRSLSCASSSVSEADRIEQRSETERAEYKLPPPEENGRVLGCRHLPLFAKVCLIVTIGIGAIWIAPIGLIFLDGYGLDGVRRPSRRKTGKLLLAFSAFCYAALFAMPFLRIC